MEWTCGRVLCFEKWPHAMCANVMDPHWSRRVHHTHLFHISKVGSLWKMWRSTRVIIFTFGTSKCRLFLWDNTSILILIGKENNSPHYYQRMSVFWPNHHRKLLNPHLTCHICPLARCGPSCLLFISKKEIENIYQIWW
jgi:hypothetical protein